MKLKKIIIEQFLCQETEIISVAEMRCQETDGPPAETILTIRRDDS